MTEAEQKPTGKAFIAQLLAQAQQDRAPAAPPAQGKAYIAGLLDAARRARAACKQEAGRQTGEEED